MTCKRLKSVLMLALFLAQVISWQPAAADGGAGAAPLVVRLDTSLATPELTRSLQAALDRAAGQGKRLVLANRDAVLPVSGTVYLDSGADVDFNNCTVKRDPGYGVFDLMLNRGNSDISIQNLKLDGNKDADGRSSKRKEDRFTGLGLIQVQGARLKNVEVSNTVNAEIQSEGTKAGIYLERCSDLLAQGVNGHHNDRSAILVCNSSVVIDGSLTHDNAGSGITSYNADNSEYRNIVTHDNGYSQLSVNGQNSRISGVHAYNGAKGFSSVNIGHNSRANDSSNTIASDLRVGGGLGWGISVNGSSDVALSNVSVSGNKDFNIYVMDNVHRLRLDNVTCFGSKSTGIYYKSGSGHSIERTSIHDNGIYGIEISKKAEVAIGPEVRIYDNVSSVGKNVADLVVSGTARVTGRLFDNARARSQRSNIWIAGGRLYMSRSLAAPLGGTVNIMKTSGGELAE